MVNVGVQDNFVDTQKSILTNISDSLTYDQITDLVTDIDSNVIKHQLTNDTIDNVFSLRMNSIQGNMWITNPEWAALLALTVDVNGVRPSKVWNLEWTDQSNSIVTTTFNAQMKTLRPVDMGDSVFVFERNSTTSAFCPIMGEEI